MVYFLLTGNTGLSNILLLINYFFQKKLYCYYLYLGLPFDNYVQYETVMYDLHQFVVNMNIHVYIII